MKKEITKILSLILASAMAFSLAACGSAEEETAEATPAPEYMYAAETLCKTESANQPVAIAEDGYYAIGGSYVKGTVPEGAVAETEGQFDSFVPSISFVANDGTATELTAYSPVNPENGMENMRDYMTTNSIEALLVRPDGNILLVESVYASWCDAESEVKYGSEEYYEQFESLNEWWLRVLNPDGSEISRAKLDVSEEDANFYHCTLDDNGNLLAALNTGIAAFDMNGETAYFTETADYVYSLAQTADGQAAALFYDLQSGEMAFRLIDGETGSLSETAYPISPDIYGFINGSGDYDLYFNSGTSVFGYDLETQEYTKLFAWIDCDYIANYITLISIASDGGIKAVYMDLSDDEGDVHTAELIEVNKVPYDASSEVKTLTLASVYPDDILLNAVVDFNRSHKDARIELKDYSEYNTSDDYTLGYTKLSAEIAAGNMPDILDVSPDFPYNRYASNGILVDLYPYLENDSELSKDDFFENVLEATEVNGGLYMANSGFGVYTAVGAASIVGDEPGITYEEYFEALSKMPEGCEGFDVGYDRDTALQMCVALEFSKLVDWTTGECRFDSEDFINILNYAAQFKTFDSDSYEYSSEDSAAARVAEGKQMLTTVIFSSVDYMITDYDAMFGGNATVVGFPTSEGAGSMLYLSSGLAITTKCEDPDTAWEFVRAYFTEDYQKKQYMIPTNKNVFESELEKAMQVEYEKDANGNYKLDENGERIQVVYGSYFDGTQEVKIYAITEAQANMLREAIADTTRLYNFDDSIISIVKEGAQAFFEGQKSAEECASLIQSKANIYVNEQK